MFENFIGILEEGSSEELLLRQIDPHRLPRHIAIIMDGNGRWAKQRNKSRAAGHRAGARSAHLAVETCARLGVDVLTLYAFSTENWKRPAQEVQTLMQLLREFINRELEAIKKNNIRVGVIGRLHELEPAVRQKVLYAIEETKDNTGMLLNVALNYSGRAELVDAFRSLYRHAVQQGLMPDQIDEAMICKHLYTTNLPNPDLLIRTSGEMRISNFLLWQIAYTELYITSVLWPDFGQADLFSAIIAFQHRDRRFGGVSPDAAGVTAKAK
ncbi:MAG: isoprenyl transferase [Acidobacteria bacterium]|nr:isoprenyl transferase [Acidobacteriota bacterium]